MTVTEFLKSHVPFLSGLSDEEAAELAQKSQQLTFTAGQTIVMQGVTVDGLHVVADGSVTVHVKPKGKPSVQVAVLGPGEVFGERSIVEPGVAGATIKAEGPAMVILLTHDVFRALLEAHPGRKDYILQKIAERQQKPAPKPQG
jgi:CRP-like cAMP-binding protein